MKQELIDAVNIAISLVATQQDCNPAITMNAFGNSTVIIRNKSQMFEIFHMADDAWTHDKYLERGFTPNELSFPWWLIITQSNVPFTQTPKGWTGDYHKGYQSDFVYFVPQPDGSFKLVRDIGHDKWSVIDTATDQELLLIKTTHILSALPLVIHREYPSTYANFMADLRMVLGEKATYFDRFVAHIEIHPPLYNAPLKEFYLAVQNQNEGKKPGDSSEFHILGSLDNRIFLDRLQQFSVG